MVLGFNGTFLTLHLAGLMGMPRRVFTYPDLPYLAGINLVASLCSYVLALGFAVFFVNLVLSLWKGAPAGDNPWNGWTLEWVTTSPPPVHNFDRVPPVHSLRPLRDLKHEQGLPGSGEFVRTRGADQ